MTKEQWEILDRCQFEIRQQKDINADLIRRMEQLEKEKTCQSQTK